MNFVNRQDLVTNFVKICKKISSDQLKTYLLELKIPKNNLESFSKKIAGTYRNAKCEKSDLLFNSNSFTIERCFKKHGCSCEF